MGACVAPGRVLEQVFGTMSGAAPAHPRDGAVVQGKR